MNRRDFIKGCLSAGALLAFGRGVDILVTTAEPPPLPKPKGGMVVPFMVGGSRPNNDVYLPVIKDA